VTVRPAISGIVAGSIAAFGFAVVHGYVISQIWFSLPMLPFAGALCGSAPVPLMEKYATRRRFEVGQATIQQSIHNFIKENRIR
jgi:phosphate/sulfate permease